MAKALKFCSRDLPKKFNPKDEGKKLVNEIKEEALNLFESHNDVNRAYI